MPILRSAFTFLTVTLLAAGSLQAGMLTLTNPSFELSNGYVGGTTSTVPGWSPAPGGAAYGQVADETAAFTSGLSGNNAIYLNGQLGQQTSSTFQTGASYTFTVDVGNPNNVASDAAGFSFGFRNTANSDFVTNGSQFVGQADITPIADGTFQTFSFTYTATAADNGNPVIIFFEDYYSNGSGSFYLDNVTLSTSAVPEPSTYVGGFLCLSVLAFTTARRWSRRRA